MRFKDFIELTEAGTTTGDIAGFSRITLPLVRRVWPSDIAEVELDYYDWQKKKKAYRVPQLEENVQRMARCPLCKQQFPDQSDLENFSQIPCPHCGQMIAMGKARGVGGFVGP